MSNQKISIKNLTLAAMFMALGIILPFFTGQIPQIGSMLLPMHLPVLICGIVCGAPLGAAVGLITPVLRSVMFGMPPLFPTGIAMAVELLVYGFVIGLVYAKLNKSVLNTYIALICAMLVGRVAWGVAMVLISGASGASFTWQIFMAGAFINAIPGIILQLVAIPALISVLNKMGVLGEHVKSEKAFVGTSV